MKKVLLMLGVMLFSASAFAMNQEAMDDKTCAEKKAAFEENVAGQRTDFVVQYILINMADPMKNMTDEQAQPLAVCYATYEVKGEKFTKFVRDNANIFPGDITRKEEAKLLDFAERVELLSEKEEFARVVRVGNETNIMEYIWEKMISPLKEMSDAQAAPKAKVYATLKVNGLPLTDYVRAHSRSYDMYAETVVEAFVDRVEKLSK